MFSAVPVFGSVMSDTPLKTKAENMAEMTPLEREMANRGLKPIVWLPREEWLKTYGISKPPPPETN